MQHKAFETIDGAEDARIVLICDHASNRVPESVHGGDLGLGPADMGRHIAYDIGARGVTLALAESLRAHAVLSTFSRLVIDPNRGEDDPTLVRKIYDGSIVPGNRHVGPAELRQRLSDWYLPYHGAVAATLDRVEASGAVPMLISIHSFTPQLRDGAPWPWHIGILWDGEDGRLAHPILSELSAEPDLCIGDNEPYIGKFWGDSVDRHASGRGLPNLVIEIRQDLIGTESGQAAWAARLAPFLDRLTARAESRTRLKEGELIDG